MGTRHQHKLYILLLCTIGIVIILIGYVYVSFVSKCVYAESAEHLSEVYNQVNRTFNVFLERNWGDLADWTHHLHIEDDDGVLTYVTGRKEYWGFSEFYFLSSDGSYMTAEGKQGVFSLEGVSDLLFAQGERIMANETLSTGEAVTVFAIPVPESRYREFAYTAIAISYTNADMVNSLKVDAFSGESNCFIIKSDGSVLLSTLSGGSVFGNYLSYLRAGSDLDEESLNALQQDWQHGGAGVMRCKVGGADSYIAYLPVEYQDCVLLGVVSESAAGASLRQIQRATVDALAKIFLLLITFIVARFVYRSRQEKKKNVVELRYREMLFDALSSNVDDIFLMLDAKNWRVDYLSPNEERLMGIPRERIIELIERVETDTDVTEGFLSRAELESIPVDGKQSREQQYLNKVTGEPRWYLETVYHENLQGIEKYIVVLSDRTQERRMRETLQDALSTAQEANAAKSRFFSSMSHDIRTPLNAIIGFTVLLARDAEQPERVREYTRKISASGQHLLSLINDVLDMSKIESGKTTLNIAEFKLPELLSELYDILRPQAVAKGQDWSIHVSGTPVERLLGDKLRLNQILLNLLSNAVKYTQEGGHIDLTVDTVTPNSPGYLWLRFRVKDDGFGMSEEFARTVFEPFTREGGVAEGVQGTGLGMAITKNLVDLMDGKISVESKQGVGSVFTMELPFRLPDAEEKAVDFHGVSLVLVVDDEEDICRSVCLTLQETGIEAVCVTEGAAAVEAVVQAAQQGQMFHLILLDWKMPGMDGLETARKIREHVRENVPILMLTSYDWNDVEEEARSAGIDAFMPKPFFVSTFQQALDTLFADHAQEETHTASEEPLKGLMLLVAEDNEINVEILSELLRMEGADCEVAVNGQEALDMFRRSSPGYYDMILMDVQMPVMNGYEATREIRICGHAQAKTIPIVAMTANAFAEDVKAAFDAGMNAHLSKPIDMEKMKETLAELRSKTEQER